MGAGNQSLRNAIQAAHFIAEGGARTDAPVGIGFCRVCSAVQIHVDLIDAFPHVMKGILRDFPAVIHIEGAHLRVRRQARFGEESAALHIRLSAEQPHVAHQHVLDHQDLSAGLEFDVIWTAHGQSLQAAAHFAAGGGANLGARKTLCQRFPFPHGGRHGPVGFALPRKASFTDILFVPLHNHVTEKPCFYFHVNPLLKYD